MATIDRASIFIPPQELRVYRSDRPVTAAQAIASSPGAAAALDGVMFENCDPLGRGYGESSCGDPDYLLIDRWSGLYEPSRYPSRGGTLSVVGRRCVAMDGDSVAGGAAVAVQAYPALVRRGEARRFGDARSMQRVWRAAVGSAAGGSRVLMAVALMSLGDFASWCADIGGEDVFYTDGGGSCRMQWSGGAWVGSAENRRVPSFLVWRPGPQLRPAQYAAIGAVVAAIGAATLAAVEG